MLYAGCSSCQTIVPLLCAGQFLPHRSLPAVATASGIGCHFCGVAPPAFTCPTCRVAQQLYVPDAEPPIAAARLRQLRLAPVVQAPEGASPTVLDGLMRRAARSFDAEFGTAAAQELLGAFFAG